MKLLKDKNMQWWEIGLIKVAVFLISIAIGAHWATFFKPHALVLGIAGIVVGLASLYLWLKD